MVSHPHVGGAGVVAHVTLVHLLSAQFCKRRSCAECLAGGLGLRKVLKTQLQQYLHPALAQLPLGGAESQWGQRGLAAHCRGRAAPSHDSLAGSGEQRDQTQLKHSH